MFEADGRSFTTPEVYAPPGHPKSVKTKRPLRDATDKVKITYRVMLNLAERAVKEIKSPYITNLGGCCGAPERFPPPFEYAPDP